ncbi:TolC family protein [Dyadobacter sp. CY356]|uniref:TolC family protein n=1 Tax=Dyadobacter sp. CY356 TaxID=2906442 RepID=UPI001F19E68E|nr:TolC family protein [Dyadobacter sp. CY356]MCF0054923.1 TolC family protein [Dyadobacter sp. CY356]
MLKTIFLFCLLTGISVWNEVSAQPKTLSLADAVNLAVENYPSVKIKLAEFQASQADASAQLIGYKLPTVSFQAQALFATSNQVRGTSFPNGGTSISSTGSIKANGYSADAVWSSFSTILGSYKIANFGKKTADEAMYKAGAEQARADYEKEIFDQKARAADAYLMALVYNDAVKVQQKNLERTQETFNIIQATTKAGLRPGVDSSMATAELSKAMLLLLESRRMAKDQKIKLAQILGGSNSDFDLVADKFNTSLPEPGSVSAGLNVSDHPVLQFYQKRIDFSQAKVIAIRKSYLPSIMAVGALWSRGSGISDKTDPDGNFNYNASLSGLKFRAYNYMAGVSTLWNISDVFKTKRQSRAQEFLTESYQQGYNQMQIQLQGELESADLQYASAIAAVRQAPVQLAAAQDAYNQADARYKAGLSTIIELTQAVTLLNRAEIDQIVAHNNVWRAMLQRSAINGNISGFLSQVK